VSVLDEVVASHGRAALDDPVALRAALRGLASDDEVSLLVTVVESGAVETLRRALRRGTASAAIDAAVRAVLAHTPLDESEARRACTAFAAALDGPPAGTETGVGGPTRGAGTGASHVESGGLADTQDPVPLSWDGPGARPAATVPLASPRRRRTPVWIALGGLVLLAGLSAFLLLRPVPTPPPDRFAVDQVGQRYRALGATLLDGALRCAPVPTSPGERERVDCSFGSWSVVLAEYDSSGRLADHRAQATADDPNAARQAVAPGWGLKETTAQATAYWEAEAPRPMSATITTDDLSLPALAAFVDGRGTPTPRPAVPGPEFDDAALWTLARPFVARTAATCDGQTPDEAIGGSVESVKCRYPDGVTAEFVLRPSTDDVLLFRANYAGPDGARPGSTRLGAWADGPVRGQLVEYVGADDGVPYLYWDQPDLQAFGLMYAPGRSQDELKSFWAATTG
jgi:hypothetical protein